MTKNTEKSNDIGVYSEVGKLKKVLVHCPDRGIGGVLPAKAQEWLYEDIVHLKQMRKEFETFKKILMAYLDPEKLKEWVFAEKNIKPNDDNSLASPLNKEYVKSDKVIDIQDLLADILTDQRIREEVVSSICSLEDKTYHFQKKLSDSSLLSALELSRILITGYVVEPEKLGLKHEFVWSPAPNLLFTRDIGIVIGNHMLLSRTAAKARQRESLLTRYIAYHYLLAKREDNVIEIKPDSLEFLLNDEDVQARRVTIEGGDVMMISPNHLLIGCSERTTPYACQKVIAKLFSLKGSPIERISVIDLPKQRSMMHLDTVMTQIDRKTWVLFKPIVEGEIYDRDEGILLALGVQPNNGYTVEPAKVTQFVRQNNQGGYQLNPTITTLKSLLTDISVREYKVKKEEVVFIYSADGEMIHAEREQWTDSCNVTAIKEGIVLGYDRNEKTAACFKEAGFELVNVDELLDKLTKEILSNSDTDVTTFLENNVPNKALLMLPSAELSRARGGPHCMTMPIMREIVMGKSPGSENDDIGQFSSFEKEKN